MLETQSLLIRLAAHPVNNPHLIDKLIVLRGLPFDWVFKKSKYRIELEDGTIDEGIGNQLLTPWEPDVDVNIPLEVRNRTEQITYIRWFPDIRHQDKTYKGFWDKRSVWGLKIDYSHGPAQELWGRIEDFIDRTLLRGEKMPEAVQVAKDQKSEFKTYLAKRGKTLSSLEMIEMDVPIVDLRVAVAVSPVTASSFAPAPVEIFKTVVTVPVNPSAPTPEAKEENALYRCEDCKKEFPKAQALRMHKVVAHRKEKVKA